MTAVAHKARVYWGDWHVFAYCTTCDWEGTRTNHYYADSRHYKSAERHERQMNGWRARLRGWFRRSRREK